MPEIGATADLLTTKFNLIIFLSSVRTVRSDNPDDNTISQIFQLKFGPFVRMHKLIFRALGDIPLLSNDLGNQIMLYEIFDI